jgi:DNA modification methylase
VAAVLAGARPHLMVTDPPYGTNYDPAWRNRLMLGARAEGKVLNDDRADWREAWALFPGSVIYVWHDGRQSAVVQASLESARFAVRAQIVWAKHRHVISRGHYHGQHEPAFYAVREDEPDDHWRFIPDHEVLIYAVEEGRTGHWSGSRKQSTLWFIEHIKSETGHGTQKPIECMKRPIENNSKAGDGVYEPFSGSGTTLIAAEMTGRQCFAIELDSRYVDVAIRRWQAFTGRAATREADGMAFDQAAGGA